MILAPFVRHPKGQWRVLNPFSNTSTTMLLQKNTGDLHDCDLQRREAPKRKRFSSCRKRRHQRSDGGDGPGPPDRPTLLMLCAFACVYRLKPTTEYFHTAAALTSSLCSGVQPASVCHVRGEAGGDRSGGRTMKMSFIQAGREGERRGWNQNSSGILKQRKPYGTSKTSSSCS